MQCKICNNPIQGVLHSPARVGHAMIWGTVLREILTMSKVTTPPAHAGTQIWLHSRSSNSLHKHTNMIATLQLETTDFATPTHIHTHFPPNNIQQQSKHLHFCFTSKCRPTRHSDQIACPRDAQDLFFIQLPITINITIMHAPLATHFKFSNDLFTASSPSNKWNAFETSPV